MNTVTCNVEAIVVTIDLIGHKKLLQLVDDTLIQAIVSPGPIKSAVDFGAPPKCSSSRQMKCPPCLQITAMSPLKSKPHASCWLRKHAEQIHRLSDICKEMACR